MCSPGLLLRVWPPGLLGGPCPLPPALLEQPPGLQAVRPGHRLAGPSSVWTPHLSGLFPPSSWPGVGRAPPRTALPPVGRGSFSACLPVCSLQSRPVGPALFRVLLLTRADGCVLCRGLSPPGTVLVIPLPPSRRCFWMIPEECPGALPRCRACDADSADCPGLTFPLCPQLPGITGVCLLVSWVLFPELKWCLVKPSPSRAAGGQQVGENVPGGRGGVPFSQRTRGAHLGQERLHVCVCGNRAGAWEPGGRPGLRCGPPTDRRAEAPPRQVWGDGRGCPGRGCPDGRVGEEEPQPGPKVGAWGLWWVEGSRHGAGECAPASNSAERILGEETHRPTRLLPCGDLPFRGGGTELTVGESFG